MAQGKLSTPVSCFMASPPHPTSPQPSKCFLQSCDIMGPTAGQSADKAFLQLLNTLQDVMQWEVRTYRCRELLQMLECNKETRQRMESKVDFR